MNLLVKIILLVLICANTEAAHVENKNDEIVVNTPNEKPVNVEVSSERKPKQYLQYDGTSPQPAQQPGLGQLPIIGTLVGNFPGVVGGLPGQLGSTIGGILPGQLGGLVGGLPGQLGGLLGGLPAGLGSTVGGLTQGLGLGNLGLGGLGNLGGLLNLGGLGGPQVGGGTASGLTCPITQKLNCKCESLVPLRPLSRKRSSLEIVQHTEHSNEDGTIELSAILSNGLIIYQRSGIDKDLPTTQGFYSLKIKEQRYLTIYFTINDADYTVKADVSSEPPRIDVVGKQMKSFV